MRASAVAGIIYANANDNLLQELTANRSMASVPFGARYRLIDFSLSNLVNAGITNVGVVTRGNYRSLMDHMSNGIYWDLDRRNGGLYILPPYITKGAKRYNGSVDAINGAEDYILHCKSDYIVLYNSDVVANVDISEAVKAHIKKNADITFVYHTGIVPKNDGETMLLTLDEKGKISAIDFNNEGKVEANFSIGITIIGRELLLKLANEAYDENLESINKDVITKNLSRLNIYGFEHKEYVMFMNGIESYYNANMDLLNGEVRHQLLSKDRPILTKTRDDMPSRYGTKSQVKNSLIADGCVIDGTVKNSVLFRGVKVHKGAVVENCILMQETEVFENANLVNVIADKNVTVCNDVVLKGTEDKKLVLKKNQSL